MSAQAQDAKAPLVFYVSRDGNDAWSGALWAPTAGKTDGPFATLQRARDAIRQAGKAGKLPAAGARVEIRGGTYPLEKGLELSAEDSGTAEGPIVYQARAGEEVRLVGGREIGGFAPVKAPAVLARLATPAHEKTLVADLKAQGVAAFGEMKSRGFGRAITPAGLELFFNDQPMTLARWPNKEDLKIAGIPEGQGKDDDHGGTIGDLKAGFHYDGDRPAGWKDVSDAWVHGYWAWDWANSYEKIESIDTQKRLIKTADPYGLYGFRKGQRFHFLNVLEEMDEPGEWFLDRKAGLLYFWPPAPTQDARVVVSTLVEPVFSLKDVSHVAIRGLTIECTRGHAVRIVGGEGDTVAGCTLRNLGNYGVVIEGGRRHVVAGCDIYNTGDGGVQASGGERKTIEPCGHWVHNNHFHHIGRWSICYVPAVLVGGVGVRVSHNLVHDHPHCPILFSGNEHVIEFNELHHVCMETGDVGAIYTGRDWTFRGNVVRYNYIHHVGGVGMGSIGIYNDDCVSGTVMYGNVFYKVRRAAFMGGGRDFRVENNVFVDCHPAVQLDARGISKHHVWHDMVYKTMKKSLEDMNWRQAPYRTRYPELADLVPYYEKDQGVPPGNILVARNICTGGEWKEIGWGATERDIQFVDNLVGEDPRFVDAGMENFQLRADSPAWKLGFKRIPIEKIGLIRDEYRDKGK